MKAPIQTDPSGSANATITEDIIIDAVNNAKPGNSPSGNNNITVNVKVDNANPDPGDLTVNLPKETIESILDKNVDEIALKVNQPDITIRFDRDAIEDLYQQAGDDVVIRFSPVPGSMISAGSSQMLGGRPAFMISAVRGDGSSIGALYHGKMYIEIPYVLQEGERAGYLYGVTVDQYGNITWRDKSSYDSKRETLILTADQFAACGIGYQEKSRYQDITGHWAEDDLEFAASRGFLTETEPGRLNPDGLLTRADLILALGRLQGINPADYTPYSQFEDVPVDSIYGPYIKWAISNGIITTPELNAFYPNKALNREELASILHDFTAKTGRILPGFGQTAVYSDSEMVAESMRTAVDSVWKAGIMLETGNGKFSPKAKVTRATGAAILHRYVETDIKSDASQGFHQNDQGQWQYYQNGEPVSGWKMIRNNWYYFGKNNIMKAGVWSQIGGIWYYFYEDGRMASNTIVDGFIIDSDGTWIES